MKFKTTNREFLSVALILFYLIPMIAVSGYSIGWMPQEKRWFLLTGGLFFAALCTLILILLLYYWEKAVQNKTSATLIPLQQPFHPLPEKEDKVTLLDPLLSINQPAEISVDSTSKSEEIDFALLHASLEETQQINDELLQLKKDNERLLQEIQQVTQDFADYKLFSEEQLKQKQYQLIALQQMVEDQRSEMEKRQDQISQLDTKIHDLSYEIKTLLYLNQEDLSPPKEAGTSPLPTPSPSNTEPACAIIDSACADDRDLNENPIKTSTEATQLLRKCINHAQKLTGANYYSNESTRYREFSSSYFAIDQRRLFDNLREETSALVLVYSQKDLKILFVNNQCKHLLGWSPDKFAADFLTIIQEGINDWKKAVSQLTASPETHVRLLAKTKHGQETMLNCHLGIIPTGLFRNHLIGVLYPSYAAAADLLPTK